METISKVLLMALLTIIVGCGDVRSVIHEESDQENYELIFKEPLPLGVEVVNSVLVTYSGFSFGVITTADWEIELIVPEKWIEDNIDKMYLNKLSGREDRVQSFIEERVKGRFRIWYVPKDISEYDCYYTGVTSIPYVHMLVDKMPVGDDKYRVFHSKH